MSLHPVRRTARMGLWPLSRPLAAVLLWSHRHTIGLWARSYATELKEQSEGTISLSRLRLLTAALWRVSSDPRFRNDPTVRRLSIDSELTEVDHDARRTSLQDALADLPGVVSVEIDGQVAQVDGLAAEGLGNDDGVVDTDATDRVISPAR